MDLKRILVAINSPNARDAAFARGLDLARTFGAELYLLHAVPANDRFSFRAAERLERMAEMRTRAEDVGVRVQTVEQQGDAAEIIELHANARSVDLIVMGSEPRSRWGGDRSVVAERVIRRTRVPTLVVASDRTDAPSTFRNVLVAVDLSPASKDVVRDAIRLTGHELARVTVMHAVEGAEASNGALSLAPWMVSDYRRQTIRRAQRHLEALVSELPLDVDTAVQVPTGPVARTIIERAADLNPDLVVVGRSRGFTLFGSTALRLLRKNDRALLVIPTPAARRTARFAGPRAA